MRGNVKLCDLSPRGDKLLYFAEQYVKPLARSLQGRYEPLRQQPCARRRAPAGSTGRFRAICARGEARARTLRAS